MRLQNPTAGHCRNQMLRERIYLSLSFVNISWRARSDCDGCQVCSDPTAKSPVQCKCPVWKENIPSRLQWSTAGLAGPLEPNLEIINFQGSRSIKGLRWMVFIYRERIVSIDIAWWGLKTSDGQSWYEDLFSVNTNEWDFHAEQNVFSLRNVAFLSICDNFGSLVEHYISRVPTKSRLVVN